MAAGPRLHVSPLPHLAHVKHDLRRGKVAAGDELLHPLPADAEHLPDLGGADKVMHGENHSHDSTCLLTSPARIRDTGHVTSLVTIPGEPAGL